MEDQTTSPRSPGLGVSLPVSVTAACTPVVQTLQLLSHSEESHKPEHFGLDTSEKRQFSVFISGPHGNC
jgi:hypothetical protein